MSIIAYASANVDPINNPLEDGEIDLASVATPASITLYGDAVDTEDGGASFSFAWTLLDPTNSGAVLSSTTTVSPAWRLRTWQSWCACSRLKRTSRPSMLDSDTKKRLLLMGSDILLYFRFVWGGLLYFSG